jgi:hypothetical protein
MLAAVAFLGAIAMQLVCLAWTVTVRQPRWAVGLAQGCLWFEVTPRAAVISGVFGGTGQSAQRWLPWVLSFSKSEWQIGVPLWIPGLLFAVSWLLLRKRRVPGTCRKCGYSLLGNTSGVCPECGAAFAPAAR